MNNTEALIFKNKSLIEVAEDLEVMDKWSKSIYFAQCEKRCTSFPTIIEVDNVNKDAVGDATEKGNNDVTDTNVVDENDNAEKLT